MNLFVISRSACRPWVSTPPPTFPVHSPTTRDGQWPASNATPGLPADGIVGPDTWRALVGAGYRLGDRLLYRRVPMMRGDDVADLQRKLNALGFDTGKVDGIFGSDTLTGLLDFQANRRLGEDGIAGRDVAAELDLVARATAKPGREGVREHQWLAALPDNLIGQRIYVDAFCRTPDEAVGAWAAATVFSTLIQDLGAHPIASRSIDTTPAPRVRAVRANRLGVDFIVGFCLPLNEAPGVFFFASAHSHSPAGERLAGSGGGVPRHPDRRPNGADSPRTRGRRQFS